MEIYIIRHGQTVWNREKRLQGSTDIELNERGLEVAKLTGEALKDVAIDRIYSSPLKRAHVTAQLIAGEHDVEIVTDARLRELSFGWMEGHCADELNELEGCTFKYFFDAPERYVAPEDGETFEQLNERAADFWEDVILPLEGSLERVIIVAHGAMNKALMTYVKKQLIPDYSVKDFWSGGLQKNCGTIILELEDGKFQIVEENHLFY